MKTRIEKDSLGTVRVPAQALYGAQTQRATENFDYSAGAALRAPARRMPNRFILALCEIKRAAALCNGRLGQISEQHARAIARACDEVLSGELFDQFPVPVFQTGSGTSSNMNMNEVLATLANRSLGAESGEAVHPNDHVNYGQSSNDVIPSALQLSVLSGINDRVLPAIARAEASLAGLATQYDQVIKTGRTHLMDAVPLSLGDEFATWRYQIAEGRGRLRGALERLAQLPLGGTAIGTGVNQHRDFAALAARALADQTQLPIEACANPASRISAQEPTLEVHGQLKVLATALTKIANDLRWMNSGPNAGLAEIRLKALQPGSSIMPGKVNPVIAESIAMMCAEVMGNDVTLTVANQSGNFQLNVMLPLMADKCLASVELMADGFTALDKTLKGFEVNEQHVSEILARNPMLATALNVAIGYEKASEIVKAAQRDQRPLIDVAEELTELGRAELEALLDPAKLARPS